MIKSNNAKTNVSIGKSTITLLCEILYDIPCWNWDWNGQKNLKMIRNMTTFPAFKNEKYAF